MNSHQIAGSPRLLRIKKVSRFFRWLCVLLFVLLAVLAVAIWFLPVVGDEGGGHWRRNLAQGSGSEALASAEPSTAQKQSGDPQPGYNESRTFSIRIGDVNGKPENEGRIRPEYIWTVRPIGFLWLLFHLSGLWVLHRLFRFYEHGTIFDQATVRCIRWIGLWLLANWALTNFMEFTHIFTHNPSFSDFRLDGYFFGGLLVLLISWIMEEGSKLQEEQEMTI